ncbi:hypothetical protein SDJN03_20895, partial [Cucurbita argyrosperma subsp. sororia]
MFFNAATPRGWFNSYVHLHISSLPYSQVNGKQGSERLVLMRLPPPSTTKLNLVPFVADSSISSIRNPSGKKEWQISM